MTKLLVLLTFSLFSFAYGQRIYDSLDAKCLEYKNSAQFERMLVTAQQLSAWTFTHESDTSVRYPIALRKVGLSHFLLQHSDSAEWYYNKSILLFEKQHRTLHPGYASTINNLGLLCSANGDFKRAEACFLKALEIRKTSIGEQHPDFAGSVNNLGLLYYNMGDFKAAEKQYIKALEIWRQVTGGTHADYANALSNLGNLYKEMGELQKAIQPSEKALYLRKKIYGFMHPAVGSSYNDLAGLYHAIGKNDSVVDFYNFALNIRENTLGVQHPEYASTLNNLGILYWEQGRLDEAHHYFEQALNITEKALGSNHPSHMSTEDNLGKVLVQQGKESSAYELFAAKFDKKQQTVSQNFQWLSAHQKEQYWKQESGFHENLSWLADNCYKKSPSTIELNYNSALLSKGFLLENSTVNAELPAELVDVYNQLAQCRKTLIKMESEGFSEAGTIEALRNKADSLDKRIVLQQPAFGNQKQHLTIQWREVHAALREGEAAIEFVRFFDERDSSYRYNALVLRNDASAPQLVRLCTEKQLSAILPRAGFSALYPLVWEPIDSLLANINTVYFAPVGMLSNVPFHALYKANNEGDVLTAAVTNKRGVTVEEESTSSENDAAYLLDRYTLHQLSSTRSLAIDLHERTDIPLQPSIALVGGVDYDVLPGVTASTKGKTSKSIGKRSSESVSGRLAYLEGTKSEVEAIQQVLVPKQWKITALTQAEASEEKLLDVLEKAQTGVLHLATHGYAFPEFNYIDTNESEQSFKYSFRYSQNPMVRSGVILSGGNWAWTGSDTLSKLGAKQNGILTALEVSQLNLSHTKLVVLSACETGLGKIEGSEGTFGLTRGFKLAGVEQLIVSLWSVPDKETMELMTEFYSELAKTNTATNAFASAQKTMRNKYPNRPDLWAGFVLVR
jgi:CHAT domain-containing protein/tetratricopeptide (TPR) repeat protein